MSNGRVLAKSLTELSVELSNIRYYLKILASGGTKRKSAIEIKVTAAFCEARLRRCSEEILNLAKIQEERTDVDAYAKILKIDAASGRHGQESCPKVMRNRQEQAFRSSI